MKKTNEILSILIIVLVLAQAVLMFIPFFNFGGTAYSIQDYVFAKTGEIGKYIDANNVIADYKVNDYAPMLALTFLVSIVMLVSNVLSRRALFSHLSAVVWGVLAAIVYLTNGILKYGDPTVRLVHIIVILVAGVLSLVRLYPWICYRYLKKK